jgi:hypothetical protein
MCANEVLMEGVVLTAYDLDFARPSIAISQQEYKPLSLQRCETHFMQLYPYFGDSFTVIEVILCSGVTCGVFFVKALDIELLVIVLKFLLDFFLVSQFVIKWILFSWLLPLWNAVIGHMMHLR